VLTELGLAPALRFGRWDLPANRPPLSSKIVFEHTFAYSKAMKSNSVPSHQASKWLEDARQLHHLPRLQLRLAAMAGHMRLDAIAARRAALVDLLADGRPHLREEIWKVVAEQLDDDCWGKRPQEALARDLRALRLGGIRIAYSRRPGAAGYYLQHPRLTRPPQGPFEAVSWELVRQIGQLPVPEKNERAFASADFALTQKRLILTEEHPDWTAAEVDREARRLVFRSPGEIES
jgi:hypothetical protein